MAEQTEEKRFEREIGGFVLKWEEASKDNGGFAWLVIRAASGQWETRMRGDMGVTLLWRRLLEEGNTEEFLHSQLRTMQIVNQSVLDPLSELIITTTVLGNVYLASKGEDDVRAYNEKRSKIATELSDLVNGLIPPPLKDNGVTDEEKAILNNERAKVVNEDLNKDNPEQLSFLAILERGRRHLL